MENLYSIKDIIKENKDGEFVAVCKSGNAYKCKFVAKYRAMFFTIPDHESIIGYGKLTGKY